MFALYKNKFKINRSQELNCFIAEILGIAENYLKFLISKNRLYLPEHITPKDAAIDLTAELFLLKDKTLIRFKDFFDNNFKKGEITNEEDFEKYLRGFIYTVIQNNLLNLYKDNDPITFNIYRNINEAVKNLDYYMSKHISDKYIHLEAEIYSLENIPEREDLLSIIYSDKLAKLILNLKIFIESLFENLKKNKNFTPTVRFSDLVSIVKSIYSYQHMSLDGITTGNGSFGEELNIKLILEDVRFHFTEKLAKYVIKNNLSQNFAESMYNIIDEIINDLNAGNTRHSVKELMKTHFKSDDKNLFYKVQYCTDIFEDILLQYIQKEKVLIG